MKYWQKLFETELPSDLNLLNIVKFCATTRYLFVETAPTLKNVKFYHAGKLEEVSVIVRNEKYFLPVNPEENVSVAGESEPWINASPGETSWDAVRIKHGQNGPLIDITDFTYAKSLVLSYIPLIR